MWKRWIAVWVCVLTVLCIVPMCAALAEEVPEGQWVTANNKVKLELGEDGSWNMLNGSQTTSGTWRAEQERILLTSSTGRNLQAVIRDGKLYLMGIVFQRTPKITPPPAPTRTPQPMRDDDFTWYTMSDGEEIVITSCLKARDVIVIPETIQGKPVVGIGSYSIPMEASTVYIPKTVQMIDTSAFGNNYLLDRIVIDQDNPYFMAEGTVIYDKAGTTLECFTHGDYYSTYTVKEGVTIIASGAFDKSARTLIFPDTVTTLEAGFIRFEAQAGMQELHIPASVTEIGETNLNGVVLVVEKGSYAHRWADEHGYFWIAEGETIEKNGLLMDKTGTVIVRVLQDNYTIPADVTEIRANAFVHRIWQGELPDGITYIGDYALSDMRPQSWDSVDLVTLVVPDTVEYLGVGAFQNSLCLGSVKLPDSMEALPSDLFNCCFSLEEVILPSNLKRIGNLAFFTCAKLKRMELPEGLEWIGHQAFDYCEELESLYIPASVKEINCTFMRCDKLTLQVVEGSYAHEWAEQINMPYEIVPPRQK